MREIKFRAWDKESKWIIEHENMNYSILHNPQERFILLQFTGLKDKNGKEIYEGDIIKCSTLYNKTEIEHIGFIKFESATFIFACDEVMDNYMTFIELFGDWEVEVIGNIYENKELLK